MLVLFLVGYYIFLQATRTGKIAVDVATVPADASVDISGTNYGSAKTIYLQPNKNYSVKIHKNGFKDVAFSQYITRDNHNITVGLTGQSESAIKWQQDNQDKYTELEGAIGQIANQEGVSFVDKNPIVPSLPYENLIYSIGYRADASDPSGKAIILTINAPEGARNAAIQQIRDLGYDPLDYKIEFSDYRNPFAL